MSSNTPLISVIIPVYNAGKYLPECVGSVLNQTYKNLEIILVDDGSTDSCPQICDEYAEKDNRVIVIHKQNGGQSDARNTGLDIAKGDYITFIDNDDRVSPDMVAFLYQHHLAYEADITCCSFYRSYVDLNVPDNRETQLQPLVFTCDQAIIEVLSEKFPVFPWAKLYSRHIFSKIRFPVGEMHEDHLIIIDLLSASEKILFIPSPKYFYRKRKGSTFRNYDNDTKVKKYITMLETRHLRITQHNPALILISEASLYRSYYRLLKVLISRREHGKEYVNNEITLSVINNIKINADKLLNNSFLTTGEKRMLRIIRMRILSNRLILFAAKCYFSFKSVKWYAKSHKTKNPKKILFDF